MLVDVSGGQSSVLIMCRDPDIPMLHFPTLAPMECSEGAARHQYVTLLRIFIVTMITSQQDSCLVLMTGYASTTWEANAR